MENSIAVVLNSPTLGGAERSILIQSQHMGNVDLIVPAGEVSNYARELPHTRVRNYFFPRALFSISRSGNKLNFIFGLFVFPFLMFQFKKLKIARYQSIWANGNKAGFTLLIYLFLARFRGKLIWHFRDYPIISGKWKYLWNLLYLPKKFKLVLVGNSESVSRTLCQLGPYKVKTVYNPAGDFPVIRKTGEIKDIGVVSMMAPWKGIHQIILWASLFEKELIEMGIEAVTIFGGQIYQTCGSHCGYQAQLERLLQKFPSKLIKFGGRVPPAEIYQQIDLLIHPVVGPEPFGRVITEAYSCGLPVLSTKLGGSRELVIDGEFFAYDYAGLTEKVRILANEKEIYHSLVERGQVRVREIEANIGSAISELLNL